MSDDVSFVDTNVLVYAHDLDAGRRHEIACDLIDGLWSTRTGRISTQVLQEFYVNVTRKVKQPLARKTARDVMGTYKAWRVETIDADDVLNAAGLEEREQLSFWDALIITSAAKAKATRVLTEDLQAGRRYEGVLVDDPFA